MYIVIFDVTIPWMLLLFLGFSVGMLSGFVGIGGGWLVTPCLYILGFPFSHAVGTDLMQMAGKALFGTVSHARYGHVDFKLGLIMAVGTVLGINIGSRILLHFNHIGIANEVGRYIYIVLLVPLAVFSFSRLMRDRKEKHLNQKSFLINLKSIPPLISLSRSNIKCSIWIILIPCVLIGIVSGFIGIGGGLLRLPMLIYLLKCPMPIAVGTDLFEVIITGFYGGFIYAKNKMVSFSSVGIMLSGAIIGTYIGAFITQFSEEKEMKRIFGLSAITCCISLFCKELHFDAISIGALVMLMIVSSSFIFLKFIRFYLSGSKRREGDL